MEKASAKTFLLYALGFPDAVDIVSRQLSLNKREKIALSKLIRDPSESMANALKRSPLVCIRDRDLGIDGFNVLITIESALNGNDVYLCSDGFVRDISLAYSSYSPTDKFEEAVNLLGELIEENKPLSTKIYLDSPIPKSGQIASSIRELLGDIAEVKTSKHVDKDLLRHEVIATSDTVVIGKAPCVVDMPFYALRKVGIFPKLLFPLRGPIDRVLQ
ncbi:MAG: hypothetical protein DRN78_06675 [Thermoproteota archaeon]|nr:MAG: hypothetical protein DRN78_06675 [Candidatus Korarchaeota archaeon]